MPSITRVRLGKRTSYKEVANGDLSCTAITTTRNGEATWRYSFSLDDEPVELVVSDRYTVTMTREEAIKVRDSITRYLNEYPAPKESHEQAK